jgi:cysteine desulfurase / selenocysteine lyase
MKNDFPFFNNETNISYLDNAATTQKPQSVIDRIVKFYSYENANVHRGVYGLSSDLTEKYENSRKNVADFISAKSEKEIIYTYGSTDSLNLLATCLSPILKEKDEIVLSILEHHSNIVPWQLLSKRLGLKIRYIPLDENNRLDLEAAQKIINTKTKIISLSHVSNVTGTINPIKQICNWGKEVNAITIIDGAQGAPNVKVDVQNIGCDFYTFSSHKIFGPTGLGVLYGKTNSLENISLPYRGGGSMISEVFFDYSTWAPLPHKFEAGTPPIAQVLGLDAAISYVKHPKHKNRLAKEKELAKLVIAELKKSKHTKLFNEDLEDSIGIVTFAHNNIHPHDMAAVADAHNVCIRAGHHCTQLLMKHWKVAATSRVSFSLYNDKSDVDRFIECFNKAEKMFKI